MKAVLKQATWSGIRDSPAPSAHKSHNREMDAKMQHCSLQCPQIVATCDILAMMTSWFPNLPWAPDSKKSIEF